MLKKINKKAIDFINRPAKVLQFGAGNFLRAFADLLIDVANEKLDIDMGIVACKATSGVNKDGLTIIDDLQKQDNMYHVCLEGVENKEIKKEIRLVKSIIDSVNPYVEYEKYRKYILTPELRFIISNTTEAGIRYVEGDDIKSTPPNSFPAKMTALLYERFRHFNGDITKGLIILCCELIEDNSCTLKKYILQHAEYHNLEKEFVRWIEVACIFCDTLVDRIVPGFPYDTIEEIKANTGFDDELVVKGELYHLWVIGGRDYKQVQKEFPLDKAGFNVLFMESIKEFRDKKVRILNGSHTGMVPVALQLGCETVKQAFDTILVERFINKMVREEVIPVIDEDKHELDKFASSILERFYNPAIKHKLSDISLNSLSKWEARNYPTLKDYSKKFGKIATCECFTFAALMTLYSGKSEFEPRDARSNIEYIQTNWDSSNMQATITKIVKESGIFTVDLSEIPMFIETAASYVESIEILGMQAALKKIIL